MGRHPKEDNWILPVSHFQIGEEVEVCRFRGAAWYKAQVTGHNFVSGQLASYKIKYKTLTGVENSNSPKIISVPVRNIRPMSAISPQSKESKDPNFKMHEPVEVYKNEIWCSAKISGLKSRVTGKYTVSFPSGEIGEFNAAEIRSDFFNLPVEYKTQVKRGTQGGYDELSNKKQKKEITIINMSENERDQRPIPNPDPNPSPSTDTDTTPNTNPNCNPSYETNLNPNPRSNLDHDTNPIPNPSLNPNPNPNLNESGLVKCTESPSNSSHAKIKLPFKKINPNAWDHVLSYDIFKLIPQEPHFNNILSIPEEIRDGIAAGLFISYANLVTSVENLTKDADVAVFDRFLACADSLEKDGFNVNPIREYLNKILQQKSEVEYRSKVKELENELLERGERDACLRCEIRAVEDQLKGLIDKRDDLSNKMRGNRQDMLVLERKIWELKECVNRKRILPKPLWVN